MVPCPICQRPAASRTENKAFPFCSPRCKAIDLGHWFDEKYGLPVTDTGELESADGSERSPEEKA
jgi:uncharacterized protein